MSKDETIKDLKDIINAHCWTISDYFVNHVANALYNAGYRKVPGNADAALEEFVK